MPPRQRLANKMMESSSSPSRFSLNNSTVFYLIVASLVVLIIGALSGRLSISALIFSSSGSSLPSSSIHQHQHSGRRPLSSRFAALSSSREDPTAAATYPNNKNSDAPAFPISPPESCLDELYSNEFADNKHNEYQQQQQQQQRRRFTSSSTFRLIPRSSSPGQDAFVVRNATLEMCIRRCLRVGPTMCSFIVRDSILVPGKNSGNGSWWRGRKLPSSEDMMFGFGTKPKSSNALLHPLQARNDFLFSTYSDEERALSGDSGSHHHHHDDRHHHRSTCHLRVGLLDALPDLGKETWVPSFVTERAESAVRPGPLSWKTGKFERCKLDKNLPAMAKRGLPPVSSLIAVGLLAGAPYLQERVLPALSSWLKNEPNLVAFVDRKPKAIRTVREQFLKRAQPIETVPLSSSSSSSFTSSSSSPKFTAVPTRPNPLFGCVSMAQLNQLYREYPEHGGDAAFPEDWDPELTDDGQQESNFTQQQHNDSSSSSSSSDIHPFPFFCNPDLEEEMTKEGQFLYKRPSVPGITHPIPIAHVLNSAARSASKVVIAEDADDVGKSAAASHSGSAAAAAAAASFVDLDPEVLAMASDEQRARPTPTSPPPSSSSSSAPISALGYILFRFIREPHHQVLRLYNGAWKNFIMLYELPLFYPSADWYVYVDDDTILMWRNFRYLLLLASVSGLHRRSDIYGGFLEYGSTIFFAHGGSGMILSHGTLWRAHRHLPGCLAVCRQFYGDTRTGCCFHGADIYERRLRFIWPYALQRVPELWTTMLSSVHQYRTRREILTMHGALEWEVARKSNAVKSELRRLVLGGLKNENSTISINNNSTNSSEALARWLAQSPVPGQRERFFKTRNYELAQHRKRSRVSGTRENEIAPRDMYVAGTLLLEEVLFSAESFRASKEKRKGQFWRDWNGW